MNVNDLDKKILEQDEIGTNQGSSACYGHWGRLSDDELDIVDGRRELLVNKLQTQFGISQEEAVKRYQKFEESGCLDFDQPSGRPLSKVSR
jgi:uncharacterized protein YjbJ (UPF0337 family)